MIGENRSGAVRPDASSRAGRVRTVRLALAMNLTAMSLICMAMGVLSGVVSPTAHSAASHAASRSKTPVPTTTPAPSPTTPVIGGSFGAYVYSGPSGARMKYYLYIPANYTPDARYPLVLILHGGGEVALPDADPVYNENLLINQDYVRAFTSDATQARWPGFVLAPQAVDGARWVNVPASVDSYTLASQPSASLSLAMAILRSTLRTYPAINPDRIYVTGISMGAFGTWEAAERWPDVFAAAMPIAGAGDPDDAASLDHMAIWAFHGTADTTAPVAGSRNMVEAIRASGGVACYTEYAGRGHDLWAVDSPLDQSQTLEWLYAQSKDPPRGAPPESCLASARN
jgi:predicted peptidase